MTAFLSLTLAVIKTAHSLAGGSCLPRSKRNIKLFHFYFLEITLFRLPGQIRCTITAQQNRRQAIILWN